MKFEFSRPHVIYSLRARLKNLKNDVEHNCGHRLLMNWAVNSKCSQSVHVDIKEVYKKSCHRLRMASLKFEFSFPHVICSLRTWLKEFKERHAVTSC